MIPKSDLAELVDDKIQQIVPEYVSATGVDRLAALDTVNTLTILLVVDRKTLQ